MRCRGAFASVSATATAFPMAGQRNGLPHTRCTCTETRSPFPSHADRPQCCQPLPSGGRYDHSCSLVQARISPDCRRITAVPSGTRKPLELIRALCMSRVEHSRHLVQVISLVVQISGQPYHLAQELTPITGVSFAQRPQRTITNQRDNGPAPSRSTRRAAAQARASSPTSSRAACAYPSPVSACPRHWLHRPRRCGVVGIEHDSFDDDLGVVGKVKLLLVRRNLRWDDEVGVSWSSRAGHVRGTMIFPVVPRSNVM